MPDLGRNDPCSCGSGKKFKNCCMRQTRLKSARAIGQNSLETALYGDLIRFVAQPRYVRDLAEAGALFWGGNYTGDALGAMDPDDGHRFAEWFIHDYRYGEERRFLIDLYIEREGSKQPAERRQLLSAWSASHMVMVRHVRRASDERIEVFDPLREVDLAIVSRLMATNAHPGDLLIGRLYELDGTKRLSATTLILPASYEQPLGEYMRNAYRIYGDEHPGETWDRFLRLHGYIMNSFLLSDRAQALRGLIGAGTRFYDPAGTRDRMRELALAQRQREGGGELATLGDLGPYQHMHQSAGGIVLPGADEPKEASPTQDAPPRKPTILIPGRDS